MKSLVLGYCLSKFIRLLPILALLINFSYEFSWSKLKASEFKKDNFLDITVSKLNSIVTQIPFKFYVLPFCSPQVVYYRSPNIGDALIGDNIANTVYQFKMMQNEECSQTCTKNYDKQEAQDFKWLIDRQYNYIFYVDDLPSAYISRDEETATVKYETGIPIGYQNNTDHKYYIYNHLEFIIQVHETEKNNVTSYKIVGFKVEPISVKQNFASEVGNCQTNEKQIIKENLNITFSYSVKFEKSEISWASRWDHYMQMGEDHVHWLSIINSIMIVLCLAGLIAHIMSRALRRDLTQHEQMKKKQQEKLKSQQKKMRKAVYTNVQQEENPQEVKPNDEDNEGIKSGGEEFVLDEIAWKKVKGEVFKKPKCSMLLSILVGTGLQILAMTFFVILFALVGIISPQHRGGLIVSLYISFILMSNISGFYSARFYKMFQGTSWLSNALLTSMVFPGFIFGVSFIVNIAGWLQDSEGIVPVVNYLALLFVYFALSIPNSWFGSFLGFKKTTIKNPGKINKLSRDIPQQPWYLRMKLLVPIGGTLPFAAVFIEFLYLMTSIWRSYFYCMFGFLFVVLLILIITSAEVAIVQTYFQLCAENYHWWWRSFFISGSSGIYLFLFSIYYYFSSTQISMFSSSIIYFSCMIMISVCFAIMTGTIGFLASFTFNRKIYSMIKSD